MMWLVPAAGVVLVFALAAIARAVRDVAERLRKPAGKTAAELRLECLRLAVAVCPNDALELASDMYDFVAAVEDPVLFQPSEPSK